MSSNTQVIKTVHGADMRMFKNHFGDLTIKVSNYEFDDWEDEEIYETATISLDKKRAKKLRKRLDEFIKA